MLFYKAPHNPKLKDEPNIGRDAAKREMVEGPRRHIFISSPNSSRMATVEWIEKEESGFQWPYYRVWIDDGSVMGHVPHGDALAAAENYVEGFLTLGQFRQGFHEMKNPNRKARRDKLFGRKPNQPR